MSTGSENRPPFSSSRDGDSIENHWIHILSRKIDSLENEFRSLQRDWRDEMKTVQREISGLSIVIREEVQRELTTFRQEVTDLRLKYQRLEVEVSRSKADLAKADNERDKMGKLIFDTAVKLAGALAILALLAERFMAGA